MHLENSCDRPCRNGLSCVSFGLKTSVGMALKNYRCYCLFLMQPARFKLIKTASFAVTSQKLIFSQDMHSTPQFRGTHFTLLPRIFLTSSLSYYSCQINEWVRLATFKHGELILSPNKMSPTSFSPSFYLLFFHNLLRRLSSFMS